MEKSKSDIAKLITNIVVACNLNFGHRSKATTVNKLPIIKWYIYAILKITIKLLDLSVLAIFIVFITRNSWQENINQFLDNHNHIR